MLHPHWVMTYLCRNYLRLLLKDVCDHRLLLRGVCDHRLLLRDVCDHRLLLRDVCMITGCYSGMYV